MRTRELLPRMEGLRGRTEGVMGHRPALLMYGVLSFRYSKVPSDAVVDTEETDHILIMILFFRSEYQYRGLRGAGRKKIELGASRAEIGSPAPSAVDTEGRTGFCTRSCRRCCSSFRYRSGWAPQRRPC